MATSGNYPGKRFRYFFIFSGIVSLIWFLIRVIPKPSRVYYPCMQAAFPVASAFVAWLIGITASLVLYKKAKKLFRQARYVTFVLFSVMAILAFIIPGILFPGESLLARTLKKSKLTEAEPIARFHPDVIDGLPARVAVLRSAQDSAHHISYEEIESMIRQAVEMAGGLESIISDGDVVVLKPNLVGPSPFQTDYVNGKTTDSRVIEITAKLVRELNPNGTILLMEASAGTSTSAAMETLGWLELDYIDEFIAIEEVSGDWYEYVAPELHVVELPDHLSLYPDEKKPNKSRAIYFNKRYFEADVIISIPCLKDHLRCGITGGVKNVAMGAVPAKIYGDESAGTFIRNKFLDHTPDYVHLWLHDFYAARPIDFVIMDGLQGLQNGPGGGGINQFISNQKNMRLIMAGKDAVALDAVQGLIMQHDPQMVNYLIYLHNHGYGIVDPALIEVLGERVEDVRTVFDHTSEAAQFSMFQKTSPDDYTLIHSFQGDSLYISVDNPIDLARMSLEIDGQSAGKYIIGGFEDIRLSVQGINLVNGDIDVLFEDRYLNSLQKFFAGNLTAKDIPHAAGDQLQLYPNPVEHSLYLRLTTGTTGMYTFRVTDMAGRERMSGYVNGPAGSPLHIQTAQLERGQYIISLTGPDGSVSTGRFIKK